MARRDWFDLFLFGAGIQIGKQIQMNEEKKKREEKFEYLSRESDPDRFETLPNEED